MKGERTLDLNGHALTAGYDFGGTAVNALNPSGSVRGVRTDAYGNLVVFGPSGLVVVFQ